MTFIKVDVDMEFSGLIITLLFINIFLVAMNHSSTDGSEGS